MKTNVPTVLEWLFDLERNTVNSYEISDTVHKLYKFLNGRIEVTLNENSLADLLRLADEIFENDREGFINTLKNNKIYNHDMSVTDAKIQDDKKAMYFSMKVLWGDYQKYLTTNY